MRVDGVITNAEVTVTADDGTSTYVSADQGVYE